MNKLRIEILQLYGAEAPQPVLVDVERDKILPNQVSCRIDSVAGQCPTITVEFLVDDQEVGFGPVGGKNPDGDDGG